MKTQPTFDEFREYAENQISMLRDDPENYTEWVYCKYAAWDAAEWEKCVKGKYQPIKNWKTTLLQCLPYREANKVRNKPISVSATQLLKQRHGIE